MPAGVVRSAGPRSRRRPPCRRPRSRSTWSRVCGWRWPRPPGRAPTAGGSREQPFVHQGPAPAGDDEHGGDEGGLEGQRPPVGGRHQVGRRADELERHGQSRADQGDDGAAGHGGEPGQQVVEGQGPPSGAPPPPPAGTGRPATRSPRPGGRAGRTSPASRRRCCGRPRPGSAARPSPTAAPASRQAHEAATRGPPASSPQTRAAGGRRAGGSGWRRPARTGSAARSPIARRPERRRDGQPRSPPPAGGAARRRPAAAAAPNATHDERAGPPVGRARRPDHHQEDHRAHRRRHAEVERHAGHDLGRAEPGVEVRLGDRTGPGRRPPTAGPGPVEAGLPVVEPVGAEDHGGVLADRPPADRVRPPADRRHRRRQRPPVAAGMGRRAAARRPRRRRPARWRCPPAPPARRTAARCGRASRPPGPGRGSLATSVEWADGGGGPRQQRQHRQHRGRAEAEPRAGGTPARAWGLVQACRSERRQPSAGGTDRVALLARETGRPGGREVLDPAVVDERDGEHALAAHARVAARRRRRSGWCGSGSSTSCRRWRRRTGCRRRWGRRRCTISGWRTCSTRSRSSRRPSWPRS